MNAIPKVRYGLIGGSGTWGARFPEDLKLPGVRLVKGIPSFKTPWGKSAPFKLIEIAGEKVLRVANHGWTTDSRGKALPLWDSTAQVAWIFSQAGVRYALVDGSVGGIKNPQHPSQPLTPWSVVVCDDFIMHWVPPVQSSYGPTKPNVRMREPFCAFLRDILSGVAQTEKAFTVFTRGIYLCAPSYRFETEAEVRMMSDWGANVVGPTLGLEATLMRNYGIHFASLSIVANVAEGHVTWIGEGRESMAEFYRKCALPVARVIISAMKEIIAHKKGDCYCDMYRLSGLQGFPVKGA